MKKIIFLFGCVVFFLVCLSQVKCADEDEESESYEKEDHFVAKRSVPIGLSRPQTLMKGPPSNGRIASRPRHRLTRPSFSKGAFTLPKAKIPNKKNRFVTSKTAFRGLKDQFLSLKSSNLRKFAKGKKKVTWALGKPVECGVPSKQYPNGYPCDNDIEADIVFVMDSSGSIGSYNFLLQKTFITSLIKHFSIPMPKTRVAVVSYSSVVRTNFDFRRCSSASGFAQEVQKITYMGRMTATGPALQRVHDSLIFNPSAGARNGVAKIVFVLTDGRSNRGVTPSVPARLLKDKEVVIFVVGISSNTNPVELTSIASTPVQAGDTFVFPLENYTALQEIIKMLKTL